MQSTNRPLEAYRSRTRQGRRVTSKTFTILGASTPDFRISTMMAPRKHKVITATKFFKTRTAAVVKSGNASLSGTGLILTRSEVYLCRREFQHSPMGHRLPPQWDDNTTKGVRSWDN